MINYADYEFYKNVYKGSLSAVLFSHFIQEANNEIDRNINTTLTEGKISSLSEKDQYKLKYTACQLCDFYNSYGDITTNTGKSVSIDGVSINNGSNVQEEKTSSMKKILNNLPHELTRYL